MTARTNCINCGAPVDLEETSCPYCETPYIERINAYTHQEDVLAIMADIQRELAACIMTPNEARELFGLPPKNDTGELCHEGNYGKAEQRQTPALCQDSR